MPIDNKIDNIIGSKLPQWLLQQLETRANQNSLDNRTTHNTSDNILFLANKSSWVRLISSVDIENKQDLQYFKTIVGSTDAGLDASGQIKDRASLAKEYILYGGTSKYLNNNSYQIRSGLGSNGAYGMLGTQEISDFGYKPMPGINSVTIETQGRLGSLRAATINFKCWDKNQLDIIDTLYFKLGFTMFLEWGHTFFYPSEQRTVGNLKLDPKKVTSTEFFAIDPFQDNLSKEKIFSQISENVRLSEGNYDAMLGICTNFNFTYTQDGGYDCTLRIMSLGVLGDSIKINNSGNLPDLLAEEIKIYNDTIAKIAAAEKRRRELEAAKNNPPAAKNPATLTDYPPCVQNLPGSQLQNLATISTPLWPNGVGGNKPFYQYAIFANVYNSGTNQQTNYYFYVDGRYQTTGLSAQGTYECRNGVLFIDGKTTERPTVRNIDLNDYINVSVNQTQADNAASNTAGTPVVYRFPSDKPVTSAPNYEGANVYAKFPITSGTYNEGVLIRQLAAVIPTAPSLQRGFKAKLSYTGSIKAYANPGGNANNVDPAGIINVTRYEQPVIGNTIDDYYINTIEYSKNNTNYKVTITIKTGDSEAKPVASSEKDEKGNVVNITPVTKRDEFTTTELDAIIAKIMNAIGFELFDLKFTGLLAASNPLRFIFEKKLTVTFTDVDGTYPSYKIIDPSNSGKTIPGPNSGKDVVIPQANYIVPIEIVIENDTSLIEGIVSPRGIIQPNGFQNYTDPSTLVTTTTTAPPTGGGGSNNGANTSPVQTKQSITSQSSLELILRTIQVHSLNQAMKRTGQSLNIGGRVQKIELAKEKTKGASKPFLEQIFSTGVLAPFIRQLASGSIDHSNYDSPSLSDISKLQIQAKFGFATGLMSNSKNITDFEPNNFEETLVAYALPYNVNQEVTEGTVLNHPVHIPLGLLLMILNHSCNIYDTNTTRQTPMVYIDFNNKHNFFLTCPEQLSTDVFNVIIPFQGENSSYTSLFTNDILSADKKNIIKLSTDKKGESPLFTREKDKLSRYINEVKDTNSSYRGRIMNVLLSVDYLIQLIKDYSYKDGSNNVYLKPFLEQLLSKINKSLGDFNGLRLAYNDQGNCFQIVDDQFIPSSKLDDQLFSVNSDPNTKILSTTNRTEIPLIGKQSIAKSIEIKTDVSSKLSNMIAISSNPTVDNKATLSTNASSIGYLNTNFADRYIREKLEITGVNQTTKNFDTLIIAAKHFNQTILDSYAGDTISIGNVSDATNYYIEKLSKVKNNNPATRASAPIPVSINFSTDGISGMFMGNAFTVSEKLLPYTYASKKVFSSDNRMYNVGFIVTGLTHTIENNSWNTSVKGNMFYLKDKTVFESDTGAGSVLPKGAPQPYGGAAASDKYSNFPVPDPTAYQNVTFSRQTLGDPINPNLLKDISKAAVAAGITVDITFARTNHPSADDPKSSSKHKFGTGVDVSIIDGVAVSRRTPEMEAKVNAFTAQLESMGYIRNYEDGKTLRAVLTYGRKNNDHDDHVHVSSQVY